MAHHTERFTVQLAPVIAQALHRFAEAEAERPAVLIRASIKAMLRDAGYLGPNEGNEE